MGFLPWGGVLYVLPPACGAVWLHSLCGPHLRRGSSCGDNSRVAGAGRTPARSQPHKRPQTPEELQQVLRDHPLSERRTVVRHDRLLGTLLPFRAFGDFRFKWNAELLSSIENRPELLSVVSEAAPTPPPQYLTPPYLSAEPEVIRHRIRASDKFLVLASDGLWELMHRQRVVQLVGDQLTGLQQHKPIVPGLGVTLGSLQWSSGPKAACHYDEPTGRTGQDVP